MRSAFPSVYALQIVINWANSATRHELSSAPSVRWWWRLVRRL